MEGVRRSAIDGAHWMSALQRTATSGLEIDWRSATVLIRRDFMWLDNQRCGCRYDMDVDRVSARRRIEKGSGKILLKLANQTVDSEG